MPEKELTISEIIERTKSFDQPYAVYLPVGIYEVGLSSIKETVSSDKGYKMAEIIVADEKDRIARVSCFLELQWIESTIRLAKSLYVHNAAEAEKEEAKDKINKFFASATNEKELQDKCVEVLKKLIDKAAVGYLKVEFNPAKNSKYPQNDLYAYKPEFRWTNVEEESEAIVTSGTPVDTKTDNIFDN